MISLRSATIVLAFGWGVFSCAMDLNYPGSSTHWNRTNDDDYVIDPHYPYCVDGSNEEPRKTFVDLKAEHKENKNIRLQVNDKVRLGSAALAKTMADGLHAKL